VKREITKLSIAVGFTLLALALFTTWSYYQEHQRLITQIDKELHAAAAAIPYVLQEDFHDRAIGADGIGPEEDQSNIQTLTALNNHLGMKFLYTVMRDQNGDYRLSSSSATEEELKTGEEVRYFTAYPDVSELIINSYENDQTSFSARSEDFHPIYAPVYSDRWGTYRSAFIPLRSPGGNLYFACADMDISHVTGLQRKNLLNNLLAFVIFTLAILPIIYAYIRVIKVKSQEYQQVHKLYLDKSECSVTDPLTQVGNRLKLDDELQAAINHHQTFGQPFGLVMIDIDHFKLINDQHGHQTGDIVLQQFAKLLVENTRANDIVGRWGGEEFMIIYRSTNLEGAYHHAEKLRKVIESAEFEGNHKIRASFGVAQPTPNITLPQLLQCVDQALYTAKEEGRNRTIKRACNSHTTPPK
jgi:diguanylate cyclase (GGDEF)-like protein